MASVSDYVDELRWRGLFHQATDEDGLRAHLATPGRLAYAGFDPTADSLTIGNLVPIMMLVHLARAGHAPVVVMGGGTGLIGDPSGKSAERQLMTREMVAGNVAAQRTIFDRVFANAAAMTGETLCEPKIVNNLDWLGELRYIDLLRDVGKHFSVNMMIQKDSVRERLHAREQGISYTEFSYMILQSYDFLHLHEREGVTLQMGGSDQFGNIVAGCDLIRRAIFVGEEEDNAHRAFGLTAPLVTKADGGKFGKTESGAVWLSAPRTTAYAMYQFWLNASDDDVSKFLRLFTLLGKDEIERLEAEHAQAPQQRLAQRTLAQHATALIHSPAEAEGAERAGRALFSGEIGDLPQDMLEQVFAEVPSSAHDKADLTGEGMDLVDLLPQTTLAKSKREAREFLANGSISVNGEKVGEGARMTLGGLLHGSVAAIRRGKKAWHLTRWS